MEQTNLIQMAAFTRNDSGGNLAGLVWPANHLRAEERQAIATEAGYSETAFVEKNLSGNLRLEFFTPNRQIDICGHATVAAFSRLRDLGEVVLGQHQFESRIGKHEVEVRADTVGLWQEQLDSRVVNDQKIVDRVIKSLRLEPSSVLSPLSIASNGGAFLLIELDSLESLKNIVPVQEEILRLSEELKLVGYYLYYRETESIIDSRMFAPAYGIPEESATGMAAGALALSLSVKEVGKKFVIRQGHLMAQPSPALLYAEVFEGNRVLISGKAVKL